MKLVTVCDVQKNCANNVNVCEVIGAEKSFWHILSRTVNKILSLIFKKIFVYIFYNFKWRESFSVILSMYKMFSNSFGI